MALNAKLLLAVVAVWATLASAARVSHKLKFDVVHENNTDLLGRQECWDRPPHPRGSPAPPPVNEEDLYMDASRFCTGAAKKLPRMRPGAVVKGDGLGVATKRHFEMKFVDRCEHGLEKQDTLDPLGRGKFATQFGVNWCTKILVDNWKNCMLQGGVGGSRMGGCVLFKTSAGHVND